MSEEHNVNNEAPESAADPTRETAAERGRRIANAASTRVAVTKATDAGDGGEATDTDHERRIVQAIDNAKAEADKRVQAARKKATAAGETSSQPETVMHILHNLGSEQASLLTGFHDYTQSLADQRELEDGRYLEALDDEKRQAVLLEEMIKAATVRRQEVLDQYVAKTLAAHEKLAERREALHDELFGTDASTSMAVALADDAKLEDLVKVAVRTRGEGLAKALLPTIGDRGLDHLSTPLLETFPELERAYAEWKALPPPEVLERQADPGNLDRVVPTVEADRFVVRPEASTY